MNSISTDNRYVFHIKGQHERREVIFIIREDRFLADCTCGKNSIVFCKHVNLILAGISLILPIEQRALQQMLLQRVLALHSGISLLNEARSRVGIPPLCLQCHDVMVVAKRRGVRIPFLKAKTNYVCARCNSIENA